MTRQPDQLSFSSPLDLQSVRADFPILSRELAGGYPLVYLDSANSSQKPLRVVEALREHYLHHNANVARAMHQLGAEATAAYEGGRDKVAAFIGAPNRDEVVFTKNASEALNLAAHTLGSSLRPGDEVLISEMEHHSNIVPWQLACERTGATLRWFGVTDEGRLDLSNVEELINEHTKVVSITWVSNALGTINPITEIAATRSARSWWWMPRRRCRSSPSTCRRWVRTCWPSPVTRPSAPPGSACCGAGTTCSRSCRRSSVVAR
jgi:cysteine desulfurase/selenocysteine lyase